jgi:AcrR family transcriptional regulator
MIAEPKHKISMKDRQRELREQTILETACELLSRKGFAAMTLEDVISEVGISKPTFYQHFTSKEQLAVSVLMREIEKYGVLLKEWEATLPPRQALEAMIDWKIEKHFGSHTFYDFASMIPLCAHEKIKGVQCELTDTLTDLIDRGQKEGTVKTSAPPKMVAQFLNSILKDTTYQDEIKQKKLTLAEMKAEIIRLVLG